MKLESEILWMLILQHRLAHPNMHALFSNLSPGYNRIPRGKRKEARFSTTKYLLSFKTFKFISVCLVGGGGGHATAQVWVSGTTCGSLFPSSTVWVPGCGLVLRLGASTFACGALSRKPPLSFFKNIQIQWN